MNIEDISYKLLEKISEEYELSITQSAKSIDGCIKKISAKLDIDYDKIYSQIYSIKCAKKMCNELSLEECEKTCGCVIFEDKCKPNRIPDADTINRDPFKYAKSLTPTELENLMKYAAYLYYNTDTSGLTDNAFDSLEYEYNQRMKRKGRAYEKIGAMPIEKIRVALPVPMPSLPKLKPESTMLSEFLHKYREIVYSEKLDGVSMLVVYKDGNPHKLYTRGDGTIGGDVTYLKDFIKLPTTVSSQNLVVRGELVIKKQIFNDKYKSSYSNARSFVSGKVNSGYVSAGLEDIEFVAYQIISGIEKVLPSQAFKILIAEGFEVPVNGKFTNPTVFDLMYTYKTKRESSQYLIDGLVITGNMLNSETFAFKMLLEEQIRDSKIIDVEWNLSRYGVYNPVAIYETVFMEGYKMSRATAHSAKKAIKDWNLGVGTKIKVARSGDVIPIIKDVVVDESIDPIYPSNPEEWVWEGSKIKLMDPDNNRTVQIVRIVHFFETIAVPRLREKTIEKYWDNGMNTVQSITSASKGELSSVKGIGAKLSEQFYTDIRDRLQNTPLDRFLVATTVFESGIGSKTAKLVFRSVPDIILKSSSEIRDILKRVKVKGVGPKRIDIIADGMPKLLEFLYSLNREDIDKAIHNQIKRAETLKKNGYNPKIEGKLFVTTGFMKTNYELEDYIYDNYGEVVGSVTSSAESVISGSVGAITTKMVNAYELGIPVYTVEEFKEKYF